MKTLFVIYLLFTTGFISLILYEDYKDHHYNGSCNNICAISNGHVVYSDVFNSKALPNTVTSIGGNVFKECAIKLKQMGRPTSRKCFKDCDILSSISSITPPKNVKLIKVKYDWSKVTISKSDTFSLPEKVAPYLFNHGNPYESDKYGRPLDSNIEVDSIIFIDK